MSPEPITPQTDLQTGQPAVEPVPTPAVPPVASAPPEASTGQETAQTLGSSPGPTATPSSESVTGQTPTLTSGESGSAPTSTEMVPSLATSAAPVAAEQPSEPGPAPDAPDPAPEQVATVPPAVINGIVYRGRDDRDVLSGNFCRVIAGEHEGRYGVLTGTATVFLDGWPATVTVRTRDDRDEYITVDYVDIRPANPGGR
jgi:hypothetical protein